MSANYDMDMGIHSGETQELNIAYECFENLYQDEDVSEDAAAGNLWDDTMTHWESDDLEGSGDARPFFDNMKSIRYVPASSFIISYLAFKNSFPESRDDLNRLNAFAEEFSSKYASETEAAKRKEFKKIMTGRLPVTKTGEPEPVESLLRELAERVRIRMTFFKELDNITKNGKWTEYFRGMLFNFDFSYLRDIAFAFDMDSQQFDVFLNKVLRRTWTNYFNREEILTHIVLQYSDSVQYPADRFQLYNDLCDKYKVRKTKAGHPEAFEKVKSEDAASTMVQEKVESMLTKIDLSGKDVFEYSPELHDILDWVYDRSERKVLKRSAERVFNDELRKLLDKLSAEIKEELSNKAEDVKDGADSGQKCSPLTMKYFAASDCVIRKGQRLIGNSNIRENGLAVEVIYETTVDVRLTSERRRKISVRVDPITNPLPNVDSSATIVKEKHVEGLFRLDSLPSSSPRYEVTDQYSSAEPLKLEVHPGNALHFTADEKAKKGTIDIICAPGTVIYKGTVLSFTYKGRAYQYRVRKDESAEFYSTVQLPVMLINADELWNKKSKKSSSYKKKIKVADTGSLIGFLGGTQSLGIRGASVINTKPISVEDPHALEKGKTKNGKANYHTLFRYLYGKEDYRGVTSYGPSYFLNSAEFKAAMLSYNSVSAFPKSEVKARDLLLTLSFLDFVTDDLSLYSYAPGVSRTQGLIDDFTVRCNAVMDKCGFMTLYSGNPYDEFLRRLLTSRSPMELYMSIFHDRHFLTQYIKVNIDAMLGDWNWKIVRSLSDGTEEIWGEGQEKKGTQTITLPRLVERNGSKYRMIITCGEGKTEVRDIIINQLQEYEVGI